MWQFTVYSLGSTLKSLFFTGLNMQVIVDAEVLNCNFAALLEHKV